MSILLAAHRPDASFGATMVATPYKFNLDVSLSRIGIYGFDSTFVTARAMVWDANGTYLRGSSDASSALSTTLATPTWHTLSTPLTITAGTVVFVGQYTSNTTTTPYGARSGQHVEPTVDGFFATSQVTTTGGSLLGASYYAQNNNTTFPQTSSSTSWEFVYAFDAVSPNNLPTAPTGLTTNSPVTINTNLTANWTHNDPDANPQSKYQIRYRQI